MCDERPRDRLPGAVPGLSVSSFAATWEDTVISESGHLLFVNSQPMKIKRYFVTGYGLLLLPRWADLLRTLVPHNDSSRVLLHRTQHSRD